MNRCRHPDHPHCTRWVMPGETACADGHAQPADRVAAQAGPIERIVPDRRRAGSAVRPILHVSGYDPRAAGGRHALRLDLRDMPRDTSPSLSLRLRSALFTTGVCSATLTRTVQGDWLPGYAEFSSRGKEHGQYRIQAELLAERDGRTLRRWACTLLVLVPRADASLAEIHASFLSTHKNLRIDADDGSIARVSAQPGGGRLDIDVSARNASIAQLALDARNGKIDVALPSLAWDEELIEIDVPAAPAAQSPEPCTSACLIVDAPRAGEARMVRLFALDECVFGREDAESADVRLAHHDEDGSDTQGLTRRISARHMLLRRGLHGFEIEDVSRYGVLVDGERPGKHTRVALRRGMRISFTASVRSVAELEVTAIVPNGVIMHRTDRGALHECFCFVAPEQPCEPPAQGRHGQQSTAGIPRIFHAGGGFWICGETDGAPLALRAGAVSERLSFVADAYPGRADRAAVTGKTA